MPNPTNGTLDPAALRHDLDALHRETGAAITMTDDLASEILLQLVMLEEVLATPWWRRGRARRRWRADVAASVRGMDGGTWAWRRLNAIGTDWLSRPGSPWALPGRASATGADQP